MFKCLTRIFSIESVAYPFIQDFSENYTFDGESHDFAEMVFVQGGKAEIAENDKIYILGDGNLIFHAPMEFHRIKSYDGTTPRIMNLSLKFNGTVPEALFDGVFELDSTEYNEYLSIHSAAEKFIKNGSRDQYESQKLALKLEAFIFDICGKNNKSDSLSPDAGAQMYKKLVSTMKERVYDNITVSELANNNYISVSYVKSLFYRYTGTSPGIYYARLRVNAASELIRKNIPPSQIAEIMNFSSPNYFSMFFKKQTGKTPSEYRKSLGIA